MAFKMTAEIENSLGSLVANGSYDDAIAQAAPFEGGVKFVTERIAAVGKSLDAARQERAGNFPFAVTTGERLTAYGHLMLQRVTGPVFGTVRGFFL